jgi:hypothetical protein
MAKFLTLINSLAGSRSETRLWTAGVARAFADPYRSQHEVRVLLATDAASE